MNLQSLLFDNKYKDIKIKMFQQELLDELKEKFEETKKELGFKSSFKASFSLWRGEKSNKRIFAVFNVPDERIT